MRNPLRTGGKPCVISGLRDDAHARLHARVARSADLRAEDGIDAFANGREVDVQRGAGHGVLLQPHFGYEEAVDDIERPQLQIDLAIEGEDQFARDDVIVAVLVGRVEANGIAERGVHQLRLARSVGGIDTGIVEVPLELLRNHFNTQSSGRGEVRKERRAGEPAWW